MTSRIQPSMSSSKRRRGDASSCRQRIYSATALALSTVFLFGLATKFEWITPGSWPGFSRRPKPDYGAPPLLSRTLWELC